MLTRQGKLTTTTDRKFARDVLWFQHLDLLSRISLDMARQDPGAAYPEQTRSSKLKKVLRKATKMAILNLYRNVISRMFDGTVETASTSSVFSSIIVEWSTGALERKQEAREQRACGRTRFDKGLLLLQAPNSGIGACYMRQPTRHLKLHNSEASFI